MPSNKHDSRTTRARDLIFSINVASSRDVPFHQPQQLQCLHHGVTFELLCALVLSLQLIGIFEYFTVADKSFEGKIFCGLLGSSGMWGKVLQFFPSPPSFIHGFPTMQTSYESFNESFAFFTWILLKTVISILGNGQEHIIDTYVSRFHAFQDEHAVTGREELATVEVSPRWNRLLTAFFWASSASYFLISWQKPSRFFAIIVEYFSKFFHGVNFQRSKSLAGKTLVVY